MMTCNAVAVTEKTDYRQASVCLPQADAIYLLLRVARGVALSPRADALVPRSVRVLLVLAATDTTLGVGLPASLGWAVPARRVDRLGVALGWAVAVG